ncbi:Bifunctional polynucleotide phosphatase/kinase [Formica fusca]
MSAAVKSCYIRKLEKSPSNVYLPDQTPIFVGRSPETDITDTKCSRRQVRLCANYAEAIVTVQQVGEHACGFNGFKTQKDVRFVARHNDRLELLYGKYAYEIEFNPPPRAKNFVLKKRSYELETDDTENRTKMLKLNNYSDEELRNDREEEEKSTSNDVCFNQKAFTAGSSTLSEKSNNDSSASAKWDSIDNGNLLIYTPPFVQHRSKIAAYDMDGTLIKTKSGLVFPKDCNDWQLLYPDVPGKLKQLHTNGYKIIIFTNQAGLSTGKFKISDFKLKIENIVRKMNVPIQVFIAVGKSIYRKPRIGMWELLEKENGNITIDKANSFYVGDAAGRPKNWAPGKKKDHSSADRLMALNLGIKFETPEEHFLKHKTPPYELPKFNPKNFSQTDDLYKPVNAKLTLQQQEMILMVGSPGSGKSHFVKNYLKEYEHVNRDTLGSWQKCIAAVEQYLNQGKSVVIDNTNPDPASRRRYTEISKKRNVPIRCFIMTTSIEHAKHNNKFRELTDPSHIPVNEIIINSYMKNYVPPTLEEGFKEIVEINFIPSFRNEQDRKLYEMYLLEN